MTKDEIENKIQLEIINVNKTIANKRRRIEPKKNKMKGLYDFLHGWNAIRRRKRRKRKKKRKEKHF